MVHTTSSITSRRHVWPSGSSLLLKLTHYLERGPNTPDGLRSGMVLSQKRYQEPWTGVGQQDLIVNSDLVWSEAFKLVSPQPRLSLKRPTD